MKDVVLRTDHLFSSHSHQQTLLEVLSEHVSLFGLRIKTFDADDTVFFPDGAHFHTKKVFMKDFIKGKFDKDLYIFHMNWNKNKKEKIDYMRQMGQWFVKETCADQSLNETLAALSNLKSSLGGNATIGHTCCSLEPIFSCHWSDKPSIHPCKDKPARDARASFW